MDSWATHLEFMILMITMIGGVYSIDGKIERQCARTDKLYEIWCETQKEIRDIYKAKFKE